MTEETKTPTLHVKLSPSLYGEWSGGGWPQGQDEGPDGRGTAPLEKMSGAYRTLFARMGGGTELTVAEALEVYDALDTARLGLDAVRWGGGVEFSEMPKVRGAMRSATKLERELREFLAVNGHEVTPTPGLGAA